MKSVNYILNLVVLSLVIVGCAKSKPEHRDHAAPIEGSLLEAAKEIQASQNIESCDSAKQQMIYEMTAALDARMDKIVAYVNTHPPEDSRYKRVALGKTFVLEAIEKPQPKPGWTEFLESWDETYHFYQQIKDQEVSAEWVYFNKDVRSLLVNDQGRVINRYNLYLNQYSGPYLLSLQDILLDCFMVESCSDINFSDEQKSFIKTQPLIKTNYDKFMASKEASEKRSLMSKMLERINEDVYEYKFFKNETVERTSSNILTLPLVADPEFDGALDQLARYIEEVWNSSALSLKIKWATNNDDLFKILLGKGIGERAYVSYRTVYIFSEVRTKSIAHEIGHVLGFRDRYYTVWVPEQCQYRIQYNEVDLMSTSSTGSVTPEMWEELQKNYPN